MLAVISLYFFSRRLLIRYAKIKFVVTIVLMVGNSGFLIFGIYLLIKVSTFMETEDDRDCEVKRMLLVLFLIIRLFTILIFLKMEIDLKKLMNL